MESVLFPFVYTMNKKSTYKKTYTEMTLQYWKDLHHQGMALILWMTPKSYINFFSASGSRKVTQPRLTTTYENLIKYGHAFWNLVKNFQEPPKVKNILWS